MKKNILYAILSVAGMQGAIYISQFILAGKLSVEEFSVVRSVEASIQLLSSIAPLGISLLIIRLSAENPDGSVKFKRDLSSYLFYAFISGLVFTACTIVITSVYGYRLTDKFLEAMAGILLMSNISRTALNFLGGRQRFGVIAAINFCIAGAGLVFLLMSVNLIGIDGWVLSRYFSEITFLLVALKFIWPELGRPRIRIAFYRQVLGEGVAISLSLLCRTGMDTLPLLILAYLSFDSQAISTFGLCTLMVSAALILPASINTVLLPRYSLVKKGSIEHLKALHSRYQLIIFWSGAIISLAVTAAGFIFEDYWVDKFKDGAFILGILSIVIPFKALSTLNANVIFIERRTYIGAVIQAISVFLSIGLAVLLCNFLSGAWGAIWATLVAELTASLLLLYFSSKVLKYAE